MNGYRIMISYLFLHSSNLGQSLNTLRYTALKTTAVAAKMHESRDHKDVVVAVLAAP
jgi:hypothetical protein